MPTGIAHFFPDMGNPLAFGWLAMTGWAVVLCTTLVLPSLLPWAKNPRLQPFLLLSGVALSVIPPVGWFSLVSPIQAVGYWFPDTGWWGLALGCISMVYLAFWGQQVALQNLHQFYRKPMIMASGLCLALSILILNALHQPLNTPNGWQGEDTNFGVLSHTDKKAAFHRANTISERVLASSAKVVVFPEGAIGEWRPRTQYWLESAIANTASGQVWIAGAETAADLGELRNGLIVVHSGHAEFLPGRFPMPGGMGWPLGNYQANRWNAPVTEVHGRRVTFSICYEDMLPWAQWQSYWERPDVHVSMASLWFAADLNVSHIQQASLQGWARMFGVPMVRAVNW